jgi:hypothetical protein
MYLDTLAREFPDLTLVGAHLGNPWYDEAAEAARWNPNLYFDMTGSTLVKKGANLAFFRQGPDAHAQGHAACIREDRVRDGQRSDRRGD